MWENMGKGDLNIYEHEQLSNSIHMKMKNLFS